MWSFWIRFISMLYSGSKMVNLGLEHHRVKRNDENCWIEVFFTVLGNVAIAKFRLPESARTTRHDDIKLARRVASETEIFSKCLSCLFIWIPIVLLIFFILCMWNFAGCFAGMTPKGNKTGSKRKTPHQPNPLDHPVLNPMITPDSHSLIINTVIRNSLMNLFGVKENLC